MYREVLTYLEPENRKTIVDCTVGVGSHALKILEIMNKDSLYVGIDKDASSLKIARRRLHQYGRRCILIKDDFRNLGNIFNTFNLEPDAVLFDLGISSYQLEDPHRGFSFSQNGPLVMRMDRDAFFCAYDLVNNLSEKELALAFKKFGEERYSHRIAHCIVEERDKTPLATTVQLRDVVSRAYPRRRHTRLHPATRVFMALRIIVNRELDSLSEGLKKAVHGLIPGGRIVVVSFHSLEDRIVKHTFKEFYAKKTLKILTKKPLQPLEKEIELNRRSRSAKLRAALKLS